MGYHRAGFDVVGVDIKPQPHYPFEFEQADVRFLFGGSLWRSFAAVHASPPCQDFSAYGRRPNHVKPRGDYIPETRAFLETLDLPYVIENVPGAPLINPVRICGSALGLDVRRHRLFESNLTLWSTPCVHGWQEPRFPSATNRKPNSRKTVQVGSWNTRREVQNAAMGIDWMTLEELSEAIPPAYTQFIGEQLLEHLNRSKATA